ncbi:ATP-dependent helicase [Zhihengliuella flava]|uniref:DNA 3'-5' helicase n=1 Tax=Zhihengliuella flava TaxID=1285193 RepID=A0A931GFP2_9MICC|nr:ATP-dependent DNA helicase [Zhihengliuella flava]MBG6085578.1 DNA helicase-2/ATP-dependent DNA helicase PcrA [Zhihengliuella flava]
MTGKIIETARYSPEDLADILGQFTPTPQQSAIISSPLEPLLVIAGAGSGKTATMADRVVWLVANGLVRPDQILGVTFTRKAAGELSHRIRAQLLTLEDRGLMEEGLEELGEPTVSTYHSYANSLVADHGLRIGIEPDSELLGSAQTWQLADRVVQDYDGDAAELDGARSTLTDAVVQFASACAEHLCTPSEAIDYLTNLRDGLDALPYIAGTEKEKTQAAQKLLTRLSTRRAVARLAERYAEAKRERSVLDYGDLVALAARIARDVPAAREEERDRFKVVLLDEFQDTSHAQMVLFSSLFGDGHAVTAVGDPNQSIYGFRGASAGQLFRFPTVFPRVDGSTGERAPAEVSHLTTAWRNSVHILQAANAVAEDLIQHTGNESVSVRQLEPSPVAGPGRVELARLESSDAETHWLADRLLEVRRAIREEHRNGAGPQPSSAVLFRTKTQIAAMAAALDERDVPYEIVGLSGLLAMPEVVDLVAMLRVLVDPNRSDALLRLIAGARWRLGPADLLAFAEWSRVLERQRARQVAGEEDDGVAAATPELTDAASLIEALDTLPPTGWTGQGGRALSVGARERLVQLRDEVRYLRTFVDDDLLTLIHEVERVSGLELELAAKPGATTHSARRHLDAFADAAATYASTSGATGLIGFLAWLDAALEQEGGLEIPAADANPEAVQLLTIHASKGLEWDVVAVAGLNDGTFPTSQQDRWTSGASALPWPLRGDRHDLPHWDTDQPDLKSALDAEKEFADEVRAHGELEERRLAYVALTRARYHLICSSSVWTGTRSKPVAISPFLHDLLPLAENPSESARIVTWCADEEAPEANPHREEPTEALWPFDPLEGPHILRGDHDDAEPSGSRRPALEASAAVVRDALTAARSGDPAEPRTEAGRAWLDEARLLVAKRRANEAPKRYEPPHHVRASVFVDLATDRDAVLAQMRRPVPRRPGVAARKGTAFHAWVEERFGATGMLDLDDLVGAADAHLDDAYGLEEMKAAFLASEWADRQPDFVEIPFETNVGPVSVRGRIDAVFQENDGRYTLVDWKTGRVPTGRDAEAKAVQLAVYRLGFARLHGLDVADVDAAFFYVGYGKTLRPQRLATEAELQALIVNALAEENPTSHHAG